VTLLIGNKILIVLGSVRLAEQFKILYIGCTLIFNLLISMAWLAM